MKSRPATKFDVCIIGSGPAGGILGRELAMAGATVALVESGRHMTPEDFHFHEWPYEKPLRGMREHGSPPAAYPQEHVRAIAYEDSDSLGVDRIQAVGGRSIHWNAVALRFAERDFREKSLSGIEEDWPISYQDLAPDYAHVERIIGVCGTREGLDILPDGEFLPPLKLRCSEEIIKKTCGRMGIPLIPTRKALLTRPYAGRAPCHYCGHCMDGCDAAAIFNTATSVIPEAEKTGHLTLIPRKIARELLVDHEGRVRAVSVIDSSTRDEEEIPARLFAVCCGAVEGPRLLLNSRSRIFAEGLANSSGALGRYLGGHAIGTMYAYLEDLVGQPPRNNDGALDHTMIPRFNHADGRKRDYVGGFQYQLNFAGFMFPYQARFLQGFGASFKKQVRFLQPGFVHFAPIGKILARRENCVAVHPHRVDSYGIPIPVVRFRYSDNDRALMKDAFETAKEILHNAGTRWMPEADAAPQGLGSHETGTTRMGSDPRESVVNSFCQTHDVKNLFIISGSCFPSFPEKNPTLTIMALAVRAARYMIEGLYNQNL